ncbi:Surface antigen [[Eubacterium] siraeum V10Sc8a]|uniref:Surface antigen n=1 Tax=[Eubacterium] siraeum V10Sc8a TaxID=717961 RepID=D4MKB8_9FIRM|nr:Surface antigen [[Eubacterium] siraeum V10Sc8a]
MIKSVKRLGAAVLSAVMMLTAVATPLGDNLPAVRESTSLTASAASNPFGKWQTINGVTTIRCTYYAWQQAYDNTGVALPMLGNGCQWYDNAKNAGYSVGTTAKARSIAVWGSCTNNSYGHVAYVVSVNGGKMTVNEGGRSDATSTNGIVNGFSCGSTIGSKRYSGSPLIGFIYLDSTPSTDNVKLLNTSSHYTDEVYDDNAIVHGEVNKPTSYPVTRIGIQVRRDGDSFSNGWSRFDNTQKTYTNSSWMSPWFNIKTELGVTLVHCTRYYYKFYAVVNGKEYWSSENTFVTTGSHSYGSWYTKTSATCTSGGTEERKCSCGATESRSTSALGHNYGSTYFEADHPHKYAHLCQRCGYKEFTGGNLAIYEKCDICYNENLPSKPCLNISSNGFKESDNVSFTWDPTDKTTHYNLTVEVLSGDEYKTVCRQTYVNSGFQATFGKGQYRAVLDSYNSNMFHQYTSDWRDWVHNSSDYVYFDIECAHEFLEEVVSPTYDNEGYTLHKCTKCGYSYKDNYTPALKLTELTGVKVKTQGSTSLTLAWDKNASASGYVVEQYKGGKWTQIAKTSSNATVTYTVNGLKVDTTYTFRIKGYVVSGTTEYSSEYTRLAAKTRIANVGTFKGSTVSDSAVKLDWSKNDKATGYVIEQYKGGKWTVLATTKNNTTLTFTVKGLAEGTAYSFRIKSFRKTGSTTEFSEYTAIKAATLLDGVSDFKVTSVTGSWITLEWAKNDKATGYAIEQYKGGKWTVIATTKNNTTLKFTVKGLKNDTTYSFRIRAYKTAGGSNVYSDYVRIAGKTRIANVASFKGSAVSASAVKLDWSKNDKATGYVIEQYRGGKWTALATTKNNTTLTFTVKGLAKGTAYSFRIKSFRKTGSTTDFSEYTAIKAATLLDGVSDLKVTSVTGSWITLEWAKNANATGYSIEQYKGGKWTVIATTKNNTTLKFTVKGLKNDTTYSFRIRAYKTAGGSNVYSDYVRIAGKTRIPNVAKFTGSAVSASAVKLDWSKNDKATGYVIEQYKGGKWTALATTKNNTTLTFTVKGLAKGTTYSFRIKSFRKTGSTTEFSEYASVKAATDK